MSGYNIINLKLFTLSGITEYKQKVVQAYRNCFRFGSAVLVDVGVVVICWRWRDNGSVMTMVWWRWCGDSRVMMVVWWRYGDDGGVLTVL
jgi:hypothetical protein